MDFVNSILSLTLIVNNIVYGLCGKKINNKTPAKIGLGLNPVQSFALS